MSTRATSVGVRDLKARLSGYLRRVRAGERLTITDRGRAIARLTPAETPPALEWAHAMIGDGQAQWTGSKPRGLKSGIPSRGKPASRMVIEDRR